MGVTIVENVSDLSRYDKKELLDLYKMMVKIRRFDVNLIRLMQEGKVAGFYHSGQGHEAIATGTLASCNDDDYIYYAHRGCNVMIAKGVPLVNIYGDFLMREIGTTRGLGAGIVHCAWPDKNVMGQSGTLGESFVLAPGTAYAVKFNGGKQVVMCYNGDGTHAREVFHGGMNFASLHKLPIVFICENNEYAISAHFRDDHAIKDHLAERAEGYCMPGYVVDGNDVLAVKEVTDKAIDRARAGDGPTFIECKVHRQRGHFEGDPITYLDPALMKDWKENKDPIKLFREKVVAAGKATAAELDAIDEATETEVRDAAAEAEKSPLPPPERITKGLFNEEEVR